MTTGQLRKPRGAFVEQPGACWQNDARRVDDAFLRAVGDDVCSQLKLRKNKERRVIPAAPGEAR